MRGRRAALTVALATLAVACGREGPIASAPTNVRPASLAPIAIGAQPERDRGPAVWTERSDKTAVRVVMTPARPIVGDLVWFDVTMTYGKPPYGPGRFGYRLKVDGATTVTSKGTCNRETIAFGAAVKPRGAIDDTAASVERYYDPGPHVFSVTAHPGCPAAAGVVLMRSFTVLGTRPTDGLHRTGSDDHRQVDVLVSPSRIEKGAAAHVFAIFEDRTGEAFGWRVWFGDGTHPIVGGPACKPRDATRDGRYERRFDHTYRNAGEFVFRIQLSPMCLVDRHLRAPIVISEPLDVRG